MRKTWVLALILVPVLNAAAAAQQPGIAPGSRIRVTHNCRIADDGSVRCDSPGSKDQAVLGDRSGHWPSEGGGYHPWKASEGRWRDTGTFLQMQSDTLVLQIAEQDAKVGLPRAALERLETPHGQKSSWAKGAGIGLLAGLVIGSLVGESEGRAELDEQVAMIVGATTGLGIGAIVGSFHKTDRWVEVPISGLSSDFRPAVAPRIATSQPPALAHWGFCAGFGTLRAERLDSVGGIIGFNASKSILTGGVRCTLGNELGTLLDGGLLVGLHGRFRALEGAVRAGPAICFMNDRNLSGAVQGEWVAYPRSNVGIGTIVAYNHNTRKDFYVVTMGVVLGPR